MTTVEGNERVTSEEVEEDIGAAFGGSGMSEEGMLAAESAIAHLRESIGEGKHWYPSLLEAIGMWAAPEEVYRGKPLCYLIAGEAFDWLLLAKRLCNDADGLIPQEEMEQLLGVGRPPIEISDEEFKRMVGGPKHRALLNYWYGVEVEGALVEALKESIRKERTAAGMASRRDVTDLAFQRAYGSGRTELFEEFRKEGERASGERLTETEAKEFTYWLFKYRLEKHDKAKVASDTKRGLQYLNRLTANKRRAAQGRRR